MRAGWLHSGTSLTVLSLSTFCCASGYFYARTEGWLHWAALLGPTVALATFATAAYIRRPSTGRLPPPSEPVADGVSHA